MILLMDVGNTNIKIGLSDKTRNLATWRIATDVKKTADEFGMVLFDLLKNGGMSFADVEGIIISSVVPSINYTLEHMCSYYMKKKAIFVGGDINLCGLKIDYNGSQLGSDRIVNAVAAYKLYGGPVITVDFGSATTFGAINEFGVFCGGLIAPGIKASMESLVNTTAKLPRIELIKPNRVIGKNTVENMQSGIIYGFTGLTEFILKKMKEQDGFSAAKVIATGGMSQLVTQTEPDIIDVVDRALSLKGLRLIYSDNVKEG